MFTGLLAEADEDGELAHEARPSVAAAAKSAIAPCRNVVPLLNPDGTAGVLCACSLGGGLRTPANRVDPVHRYPASSG